MWLCPEKQSLYVRADQAPPPQSTITPAATKPDGFTEQESPVLQVTSQWTTGPMEPRNSHAESVHMGVSETGLGFVLFLEPPLAFLKIIQQGNDYQDFHNFRKFFKHYHSHFWAI